jgi:hypothetical protein
MFFSLFLALGMAASFQTAMAADGASPVEDTVRQLVDSLVQQGSLSAEQGEALRKRLDAAAAPAAGPKPQPGDVQVPYVPDIVKDEISRDVSKEVRDDVMKSVMVQAREERWGLPGVVPAWVARLRLYGDMRVRAEGIFFANGNAENVYYNFLRVNSAGGIGKTYNPYINVSTDRQRLRVRARLGMDVLVNEQLNTIFRISTGSLSDPVSTNQTLGLYGLIDSNRYTLAWDQAYMRYKQPNNTGYDWFTLLGGRMASPWVSTDLVWDGDINFEGIATTLKHRFTSRNSTETMPEYDKSLFWTVGVFPLQEVDLSSRDKWLLGTQVGGHYLFDELQSKFTLALAYYDYENIVGQRNAVDSNLLDFTAPPFLQKGNTLYDIRNDSDPSTNLWALASNYKLLNLTAKLDLAYFAPSHVWLTLDYVKNLGFDSAKVAARTGAQVEGRTTGYQAIISAGWPKMTKRGDWRVSLAYKYLQRDAVLDAFTDSDFHLGGTDAQGYILGGEYGLDEDTWLSVRWLSTDAIDGPPLGIDILQFDVNSRF